MNTIKEPVRIGFKCNHTKDHPSCKICKHNKLHPVYRPNNASSCTQEPCMIGDTPYVCVEVFEHE